MNQMSKNVAFVYSLLIIDLLVNIADNVVSTNHISRIFDRAESATRVAFMIYIIQVFAIIIVVLNLIWHFLNISDKVEQSSYLVVRSTHKSRVTFTNRPLPHRLALKLVLDKYWWSLLVGALYLVLTIILQIIRLDSAWHLQETAVFRNLRQSQYVTGHRARLQYYNEAFERNPTAKDHQENSLNVTMIGNELLTNMLKTTTPLPPREKNRDDDQMFKNLVPIMIILVHKLVSTCYYISFVVIYRLQPSQMVNRVLASQSVARRQSLQHQREIPAHQASRLGHAEIALGGASSGRY